MEGSISPSPSGRSSTSSSSMRRVAFKVDPNYFELCTRTIKCCNELNEKMNRPEIKEMLDKEVLVIFGKTRSGKSTFLLRMASEMQPGEFMKLIDETKQNVDVIYKYEDIEVAYGHKSVTIVPNFFVMDGRLIVDLAGFDDLTPERRPIISLLNYHLLSRIPNAKMLTVISLESLLKGVVGTTIKSFQEHYVNLLGSENIARGLSSTCFLITRADVYGKTMKDDEETTNIEKAFDSTLREYAVAVQAEGNQILGHMAAAVSVKRVIIDYNTEKKVLLEKMEQKLARIETMNASLIKIDIDSIENIIVKQCVNVTKSYYETIGNFSKELDSHSNDVSTIEGLISRCGMAGSKLSEITSKRDVLEKRIEKTSSKSIGLKAQLDGINIRLSEQNSQLQDMIDQQRGFEEKVRDFQLLELTVIHSTLSESDGKHKIYVSIEEGVGLDSPMEVILMETTIYNSLSQKIKECESIQMIKKLGYIDLKETAYAKEIKLQRGKGFIKLSTKLDIQHTGLVIKVINVSDTRLLPIFTGQFDTKIKNMEANIASIEANRSDVQKQLSINDSTFISQCDDMNIMEQDFEKRKDQVLSDISDYMQSLSTYEREINDISIRLKTLFEDPILKVTFDIGKVLKDSRIGFDFLTKLENHQKDHQHLTTKMDDIMNKIRRLQSTSLILRERSSTIIFRKFVASNPSNLLLTDTPQ